MNVSNLVDSVNFNCTSHLCFIEEFDGYADGRSELAHDDDTQQIWDGLKRNENVCTEVRFGKACAHAMCEWVDQYARLGKQSTQKLLICRWIS